MTTLYKRAGAGNWSDAASWSLSSGGGADGSTPTAADDCIMDANSGNLTINGTSGSPNLCRSFVTTGATATLTQGSGAQLNIGDGTAGNFTIVSGITYTPNTAGVLKFVSTTTGNQITFGGKTICSITFDGVGGEWTFQDTLNMGNTVLTLTNGSLITNNQTVTAAFSSNNTNTRSLTLGTTAWSLSSAGSWTLTDSTNMTLSASSSTISSAATTNASVQFNGGGLTYGTFSCTSLTTGIVTINQSNTFASLVTSCAGNIDSAYHIGANQTVTGTWTANGNSVVNRAYIRSSTVGTQRDISANAVSFTNLDIQDIEVTGVAAGTDISAISGLSGDCGNNGGLTFTTPTTVYWVPTGGTSTGSMSVTTRWATSSGGTAGTGRSPLPQDTAVFDANSIDAGSRTITQNKPRIGVVNWTGVTNTPAFAKTQITSFYGNITMVAGMTNSGTPAYTYMGAGSSTFISGGNTFTNDLTINCGGGTLTQGDNLACGRLFTSTSGTYDSSTYTASFTTGFSLSGGTVTFADVTLGLTSAHTGATVTIGSGGMDITGSFTKSGTGTMTINGNSTVSGNATFSSTGTLNLNADLAITGTLQQTGQNVVLTDARLSYSGGYFEGAGAGGGGGGSFTFVS